jgi:hypothetical protein
MVSGMVSGRGCRGSVARPIFAFDGLCKSLGPRLYAVAKVWRDIAVPNDISPIGLVIDTRKGIVPAREFVRVRALANAMLAIARRLVR